MMRIIDTEVDKYGIEIEFGSTIPIQVLCNNLNVVDSSALKINRDMFFNIGTDDTVDTYEYEGFELRTPTFKKFPGKTLNRCLLELQRLPSVGIHDLCGLHIHASGPSFTYLSLLSEEEFYALCKKFYLKNKPNLKRSHFCSIDEIAFNANTKNRPIRRITENHFEFRVFNSSFDYNYVLSCFNKVLRFREFCYGKCRT